MKNGTSSNPIFQTSKESSLEEDLAAFMKTFDQSPSMDTKYQYTSLDVELVMKDPDEYIIPELQSACKKLWAMNIFTVMCSNREDGGHSYIWTSILSEENQAIFDKLKRRHHEFSGRKNATCKIDFFTEGLSEEAIENMFDNVISRFKPQDVQKDYYQTIEEFLIDCGCYREIPNPNKTANQPKFIKVYDATKVKKPIAEYLKEKRIETYDPETQRIYRSEFFYKRHLDFVANSKQSEEEKTIIP